MEILKILISLSQRTGYRILPAGLLAAGRGSGAATTTAGRKILSNQSRTLSPAGSA
ncbi:MAG: hypothetical protein ABIA75_14030 [Candidatus Neomarinimicrobiota bacterium]